MSYTFSWESTPLAWPSRLGAWNWRSENYRTPVPCKHGANCLYTGICSFVHPGEEGTGLKYFPGRSYLGEDGAECWESAVVRLIGGARYYERRRLRLSWADWCARVGLPLPQRPAPSAGRRERLDLSAAPPTEVEVEGQDEFVASAEDQRLAEERAQFFQRQQQAAYQAHLAWIAQIQHQAQQYALWQQQQRALAEQQFLARPEASYTQAELAQAKNLLGEQLYPLVQDAMEKSAADREILGWSGSLFTAGRITGMLLEGCSVAELRDLLVDDAKFSPLMMEACEVLKAAQDKEDAKQKVTTTVEVREAPPSATGLVGLAACADDSLKDLLEDIRREDAGLPPIERPPTITSYTPQADGKVRIVKTTLPMPKPENDWGDWADEAAEQRAAAAARVAADRADGWQKVGGDQLRRQAMKNARSARR